MAQRPQEMHVLAAAETALPMRCLHSRDLWRGPTGTVMAEHMLLLPAFVFAALSTQATITSLYFSSVSMGNRLQQGKQPPLPVFFLPAPF